MYTGIIYIISMSVCTYGYIHTTHTLSRSLCKALTYLKENTSTNFPSQQAS